MARPTDDDLQEYLDDKEALRRLIVAFDKIASEHRELLIRTMHDKFGARDVLECLPNPQYAPERPGNPISLRYMIAQYLMRWTLEIIAEEGGEKAVDSAVVNTVLQARSQHICGEEMRESSELYRLLMKIEEKAHKRRKGE